MAAYLPLTLFYLVIIFFKINTTSSVLFAVVYFCQTLTVPLLMRMVFAIVSSHISTSYFTAAMFVFSLFGIWNLDFFRVFYSDISLGTDVLPTLALDYAIAVYPLFLLIISYLLIVLYDRNYRIVKVMWRPFHILLSLIHKKWEVRTSLIDVFATFFFLSNVKFFSVSFDLLTPTPVYHLYPDHYNHTLGLLYAGHIEYFGSEHLPYAILALTVLSVFVVFPIIVISLYPFAFFQKTLNLFPFRWYILHTFVDSFYGCYKDGTQPGTRDYRWFASIFFVVRFIQFLLFALPDATISVALCVVTFFLHAVLVVFFQPFKASKFDYNALNTLFLLFVALMASNMVVLNFCIYMAPQFVKLFYVLFTIFMCFPLVCAFGSSLYWICHHKKFGTGMVQRLRAWRSGYDSVPEEGGAFLPDRMENSVENLTSVVSTNVSDGLSN
jgi:hypothetical protein